MSASRLGEEDRHARVEQDASPANERDTPKGRERSVGVVLKRYLHKTFTAYTETKRLRLRLDGGLKRWKKGKSPHTRYFFEVIEATDRPTDEQDATEVETLNSEHSSEEGRHQDGTVTKDGDRLP